MDIENQIEPTVSLKDYGAILRRRRAVILWTFAIVLLGGVLFAWLAKPVYTATTQLLIDNPSATTSTVDSSNPLSSIFITNQPPSLETQISLLQSAPLLSQVSTEIGGGKASVSVEAIEGTNILAVTAKASDPEAATAFANRLAQDYVSQTSSSNTDEINGAIQTLKDAEKDNSDQLNDTDAEIKVFKQERGITDLEADQTASLEHVNDLSTQLQTTQLKLAQDQVGLSQAQGALATEPAATSVTLAATNPNIAELTDQINTLTFRRAQMTAPGGFTSRAPQVMQLDAQIRALRVRLAHEPAEIKTKSSSPDSLYSQLHAQIVSLRANTAADTTEIALLKGQLATAQTRLAKFSGWGQTLDRLTSAHNDEAKAEAEYVSKLNDLSLREKAQRSYAHQIQDAYISWSPAFPNRPLTLLFSTLLGLFLGTCLALVFEFLDDRLHRIDDGDRLLGLTSLGAIPLIPSAQPRLLPQMGRNSPALESYRTLRTNLHFASLDEPCRSIVITSAGPGEGKTTMATNLAHAIAMDGRRVILVDTDLRKPSVHNNVKMAMPRGLTDILLGSVSIKDVLIDHTDIGSLKLLLAGTTPPNPAELLGSRAFRQVCEDLLREADVVIFDSPPVLYAADAQILASQMDGTIVVVEMGETRKAEAQAALALLRQARARVLGVTYNKALPIHGGRYGYGYYREYPNGSNSNGKRLEEDTKELVSGEIEK